ncbi:MAG: spermidine synthase, partial [Verrucomicrobia bacterium]
YGSNTLGAVGGAVLGEGYLITAFGLRGTSLAAGFAVCIAAVIALLVARFGADVAAYGVRGNVHAFESAPHSKFPFRLGASYRLPWRLLLVSFGTGCILLSLEVVWFRFLRLYLPSSATAFAVMLAVVLAGIGLGGLVSGALHRSSTRPNHLLSVLLLLAAIATLLSYLFFPPALVQMRIGTFDLSWRAITLGSIVLMFSAALLSGILFPSIV